MYFMNTTELNMQKGSEKKIRHKDGLGGSTERIILVTLIILKYLKDNKAVSNHGVSHIAPSITSW